MAMGPVIYGSRGGASVVPIYRQPAPLSPFAYQAFQGNNNSDNNQALVTLLGLLMSQENAAAGRTESARQFDLLLQQQKKAEDLQSQLAKKIQELNERRFSEIERTTTDANVRSTNEATRIFGEEFDKIRKPLAELNQKINELALERGRKSADVEDFMLAREMLNAELAPDLDAFTGSLQAAMASEKAREDLSTARAVATTGQSMTYAADPLYDEIDRINNRLDMGFGSDTPSLVKSFGDFETAINRMVFSNPSDKAATEAKAAKALEVVNAARAKLKTVKVTEPILPGIWHSITGQKGSGDKTKDRLVQMMDNLAYTLSRQSGQATSAQKELERAERLGEASAAVSRAKRAGARELYGGFRAGLPPVEAATNAAEAMRYEMAPPPMQNPRPLVWPASPSTQPASAPEALPPEWYNTQQGDWGPAVNPQETPVDTGASLDYYLKGLETKVRNGTAAPGEVARFMMQGGYFA